MTVSLVLMVNNNLSGHKIKGLYKTLADNNRLIRLGQCPLMQFSGHWPR